MQPTTGEVWKSGTKEAGNPCRPSVGAPSGSEARRDRREHAPRHGECRGREARTRGAAGPAGAVVLIYSHISRRPQGAGRRAERSDGEGYS